MIKRIVASLMFFLIVAVVTSLIFLGKSQYWETKIVQQVYAQTGWQIKIRGGVHWIFFPKLAIVLNDVELVPQGTQSTSDFQQWKADQLVVILTWKSLFAKSLQINALNAQHATIVFRQPLAQHLRLINISGDVLLNLISQKLTVTDFTLDMENLHLTGTISGRQVLKNPEFDGHFNISKYDLWGVNTASLQGIAIDLHLAKVLSGTVSINRFIFGKLMFQNLRSAILIKTNQIQLSAIQGKVAAGHVHGEMIISEGQTIPHLQLNALFDQVELGQLFNTNFLQGTANLAIHITTHGNSASELLNAAVGTADLTAHDGLLNIAFFEKIAAMPIKSAHFTQLTATANLHDASLTNQDLVVHSPTLQATGSGTINLRNSTLQYRLQLAALGISVPLKIEGAIAEPVIKTDLDELQVSLSSKKLLKAINKNFKKLLQH